jgi:hypothetical protein
MKNKAIRGEPVIGARVPRAFAEKLAAIAHQDDRTVSSLIRRIILDYLKGKGA